MKESGLIIIWRDLESTNGLMEEYLKGNIRMTRSKVMDSINGLINENTKEIGQMENNMALDDTSLLKKKPMEKKFAKSNTAFGKTAKGSNGSQMKWLKPSNEKKLTSDENSKNLVPLN